MSQQLNAFYMNQMIQYANKHFKDGDFKLLVSAAKGAGIMEQDECLELLTSNSEGFSYFCALFVELMFIPQLRYRLCMNDFDKGNIPGDISREEFEKLAKDFFF